MNTKGIEVREIPLSDLPIDYLARMFRQAIEAHKAKANLADRTRAARDTGAASTVEESSR